MCGTDSVLWERSTELHVGRWLFVYSMLLTKALRLVALGAYHHDCEMIWEEN